MHRGVAVGAAGFEKAVAIKFLDEHAADMLPRLRDEARLLAHLSHRAIVRVDDLVELDGRWAVVMELVEGQDLARIAGLGPIPPRVVCELGAEAAAGLDAAHAATHANTGEPLLLVHRDVKPSNLRITPRGEVKLLDFGVALATFATREGDTRSIAFGSPGYLAPERHDGIDTPAADVYALGVVLAECLLGERLGPSSVEPGRHAARVEEVAARLPGGLAEVVAGMLDYRREARPTAAAVSHRLAALGPRFEGPTLTEWAPLAVAAAARLPMVDLPSFALSVELPSRAEPSAPLLAGYPSSLPVERPSGGWRRVAWLGGLVGVLGVGAWLLYPPAPRTVDPPIQGVQSAPAPALAAPVPPVPTEAVAPVAAVVPRRSPPAPTPAFGRVLVAGDADEVRLVGPAGTVAPGERVPAGSWQIVARFGAVEVRPPDRVTVPADGTVRVRCLRAVENCVVGEQ